MALASKTTKVSSSHYWEQDQIERRVAPSSVSGRLVKRCGTVPGAAAAPVTLTSGWKNAAPPGQQFGMFTSALRVRVCERAGETAPHLPGLFVRRSAAHGGSCGRVQPAPSPLGVEVVCLIRAQEA